LADAKAPVETEGRGAWLCQKALRPSANPGPPRLADGDSS